MAKGILVVAPRALKAPALEFLQTLLKHHQHSVAIFEPMEQLGGACLELCAENKEAFFTKLLSLYTALGDAHDYILVGDLSPLQAFYPYAHVDLARHLNLIVVQALEDLKEAKLATHTWQQAGLLCPLFLAKGKVSPEILDLNTPPEQAKESYQALEKATPTCLSPLAFQHQILERAKGDVKTIVLPESGDVRILRAAHAILQLKAAKLILLGEKDKVHKDAEDLGLDLQNTLILDPSTSAYLDTFANTLYELRKNKGLSLEEAQKLVKTPTYFGTMLVYLGHADGMVSGATHTTADTVRPALQIIKLAPGNNLVSSVFFMCLDTKVYVFGDCAINPNPNSAELAQIALASAKTAKAFGFEPKVAMLSYSTATSGKGPDVDKVSKAVQIAKELDATLALDGPLQFDASVDVATGSKKMPGSLVAGHANTFIFPDLDAGNITYKAVQRCANTLAIGPVLQGLKKPVNDLSRGCLVEDVINTIIITAIQAQGL
ncbi:phosphate acetyltransferase [Helicobacter sp. NHP22-001]|uniref:phosphate acetyltransferase n=1 Tax=Helicobacter sp. NHP22-001 TaxID=3040202 RepID=UPI00244D97A1|nr:phosphate acetyltransferase [Helicobacter sp. NHP22-001]GMB96368.1 Phosphotransacetylase [Helicobacter sp. NHP22-001]